MFSRQQRHFAFDLRAVFILADFEIILA